MKIALVSPYDYPYPGGVTAHISHLVQEFTRLGHEVKVIAPSSSDQQELAQANVYKVGSVIPIPANGSVARITLSLRMSGRVKRILHEEQFDIIHLHEPLVPGLPLTVLHHSKSVNIGTFHAYWGINIGYFYSNPLLRRFAKKLHGRTAVSPAALRFVSRHFPGRYEIIPNGIDVERFGREVEPLPEFKDGKLNILFVGRLDRRKGFKHLLRAFYAVQQELPNTRLLVAGAYSDKARRRYEEFAVEHGLKDVCFLGYLPIEQLARCYRTADVFCAPSTGGESFGIVLLEGMAAGRAIVASDIEGYRSVVSHGEDGILVPPKDDKALARALIELLLDANLREAMGTRGWMKAQEYSWTKVAQRVLAYYDQVRAEREAVLAGNLSGSPRFARTKRWARKLAAPKRWAGKWITPRRWTRRLINAYRGL
ncbi:MAG: glycosyltransferase family 4 protein [Chloroflexota bacterium]